MLQFIFGGVLDRFPNSASPSSRSTAGGFPYFESQADDNFMRHRKASLRDAKLTRLPSEYMHEFFPAAFITDPFAVENRHRIGVDRMLWSSDYPHITTDWPYSWKTINATFSDVPPRSGTPSWPATSQRLFKFGSPGKPERWRTGPTGPGGPAPGQHVRHQHHPFHRRRRL